MAAGLEVGRGLAKPGRWLTPAVGERGRGDEPPGQVIPARSVGSEVGASVLGEEAGQIPVPVPPLEYSHRIAQVSLVPANGGALGACLLDRGAAVLTEYGTQDRVVAPCPPQRKQRGVAAVGDRSFALPERARQIVEEERGGDPGQPPGGEQHLRIVGHYPLGPFRRTGHLRAVSRDRRDQRLHVDRDGLGPSCRDLPGTALAQASGRQGAIEVGLEAPDVGQLKIDHGGGRYRASGVSELPRLAKPCSTAIYQRIDRAEPVKRADPLDRELVIGRDLVCALESKARGVDVALALSAPDYLKRLDRDLGGPAIRPGGVGAGQRPAPQPLCLIEVALVDRGPGGGRVDPAGDLDIVQP